MIHYFIFIVAHLTAFYMLSLWCEVLSHFYAVVNVCVQFFLTLMCQSARCFKVTGTKERVIIPKLLYFCAFYSRAVVTILDILLSSLLELRWR